MFGLPIDIWNAVGYAVALGLGWYLKNRTSVSNQAIPVINFLVNFLGQLLLQVQPAEAGVFSVLGVAGSFLANTALEALVITVAASGTQSSAKATGRLLLPVLKQLLLAKAAKRIEEEQTKDGV